MGCCLLHDYGDIHRLQAQMIWRDLIMNTYKNLALFAGGVLFGSAGFKLLSSKDAKKAYTHATAAALRMKDSVMETVTSVQENASDILASAKDINEQRAAQEDIEVQADAPVVPEDEEEAPAEA
jgi:hypothetical protein